jgi:putative transposase
VKRRQAYKFEVMENGSQQRDARCFAGACRFVFNRALALQEQNYKDGGKFIRYDEMSSSTVSVPKSN